MDRQGAGTSDIENQKSQPDAVIGIEGRQDEIGHQIDRNGSDAGISQHGAARCPDEYAIEYPGHRTQKRDDGTIGQISDRCVARGNIIDDRGQGFVAKCPGQHRKYRTGGKGLLGRQSQDGAQGRH